MTLLLLFALGYVAIGLIAILVVGTFCFSENQIDEGLLHVMGVAWPFFLIVAVAVALLGLAFAPFTLTTRLAKHLNQRWRHGA